MLKFIQNFTYIILQIILLPLAILGSLYAINKEKKVSKRLYISYTAGQVIQGQWLMHYFKIRKDKNIIKFIKKFPAESHLGLYLIFFAAIIANRISGFIPKAIKKDILQEISSYSFLFYRTKKFDQIIEENINKVKQFVIIGAGFDLRSIKFYNKDLKVFELDQKNTQDIKIQTLKEAKIYKKNIKYINCDLNNYNWADSLITNGFKTYEKTLFLFESVSCYINKPTVENIYRKISNICPKGSLIAQDFYSTNFLHGNEFKRVKNGKKVVENFGEPWDFTIDMTTNPKKEINKLLSKNNLSVIETFICGEKSTKSKNPFYAISLSSL
jgi:methyltransferase (TIGR00027 family)